MRNTDRAAFRIPGIPLAIFVLGVAAILVPLTFGVGLLLVLPILRGFVVLQPNEALVLTFLGRYSGTLAVDGVSWINPFAARQRVSLRAVNFSSATLKVNDRSGNPIEIAAVIAWKVAAPAQAVLDVEDYRAFVSVSAETSIRALAAAHDYDHPGEDPGGSLRGDPEGIAAALRTDLLERLAPAGVTVLDARISHLAYAPEIAQAMLRRQQAQAVIAARRLVVEGAVGMVQDALRAIEEQNVATFSDEQRARMVNNLLVALVSESEATPVINAGG